MYLLDTNHCSRILQGHAFVADKLRELGTAPISTCVIVQGELMFMAQKSQMKAENLSRVRKFLKAVRVYPIDDKAADIYGKMKSSILDHFGPKEKAKRRNTYTTQLGFGENDLWIASVAKRFGLIVVSGDKDFERIREVENILLETWW